MFDDYYNLSAKPFQLTPDPEFYFRSITHKKALSYLGYGLAQAEGFIVITGEIGAGKSTLVAHMMENVDPSQVSVAQVVTSKLDEDELVHVVARAFGLDVAGHDKASALSDIENFLHEEAREGRRCLLVVDESQNLSVSALEELRMLSNFQLGSHPLLQVLLLGQPEFRATLQHEQGLEQLRQRVIAAHHLEAMQAEEIEPYITSRLTKVGWSGNPAFSEEVFAGIFAASGGIPRRINQIANRVLLLGAVEELQEIDGVVLQAVLDEMAGERSTPDASAVPEAAPEADPVTAETAANAEFARQEFVAPQAEVQAEAEVQIAHEPVATPVPALDPQLVEDLLAERDAQIAQLEQAVAELAEKLEAASQREPDPEIALLRGQLAERDTQIAELQEAVVELANQVDEQGNKGEDPAIDAIREQFAKLEARSFEQERTIRQTLSMLIEWIEGELDESKAA